MKKIAIIAMMATTAIMISSCSKDTVPVLTMTDAQALATGTWKVSNYHDNSNGSTSDFDGYVFVITDNGTLTATFGASAFSGTWELKSSDDDPKEAAEISFTITGDDRIDKVDGSWLITELTDATMVLSDDTPGEVISFSHD